MQGSTGLLWQAEVKKIRQIDHEVRTFLTRERIFATIRAPADVPLSEGKKFIRRQLAHLTQSFHRGAGLLLFALMVYERKIGGHLHAHLIIYLQNRKARELVVRWAELYEPRPVRQRHDVTIHARPACVTDAAYITKQRERFSDEFEANIRHQRQPGAYIPGNRWTMTGDLKAALQSKSKLGTPQELARAA